MLLKSKWQLAARGFEAATVKPFVPKRLEQIAFPLLLSGMMSRRILAAIVGKP